MLNQAIMRTAFPSLVFAAIKPATKTTNYKAAAYGGVIFFEVNMRKYLLISIALAVLFSSSAYSETMKPGTYKNLEAENVGKVGKLLLHPVEDNRFLFSLKLNRGKPSYNSGHLYGDLQFKDNFAVFESSDYMFKDKICTLKFENKGSILSITTVNSNKQCGFGFGVYADGEYHLTSKEIPEGYVDTLGNTVKFP